MLLTSRTRSLQNIGCILMTDIPYNYILLSRTNVSFNVGLTQTRPNKKIKESFNGDLGNGLDQPLSHFPHAESLSCKTDMYVGSFNL